MAVFAGLGTEHGTEAGPSGLREQAGHMTASDFCAARYSQAALQPSRSAPSSPLALSNSATDGVY